MGFKESKKPQMHVRKSTNDNVSQQLHAACDPNNPSCTKFHYKKVTLVKKSMLHVPYIYEISNKNFIK